MGIKDPVFWAAVGFALAFIANLVIVVKSYTTMGNKIDFLSQLQKTAADERQKAFDKFDKMHGEHYGHARETPIHQVALSRETTLAYFEKGSQQMDNLHGMIKSHTEDDMRELKKIGDGLERLNERFDEERRVRSGV